MRAAKRKNTENSRDNRNIPLQLNNSNMIDQGFLDLRPFHIPSFPTHTFLSASTVECSALGNKKAIVATKICVGTKQGER